MAAAPLVPKSPDSGAADPGGGEPAGAIEQLKIIGGLVALGTGLAALVLVVIVALLVKPDTTGGSVATSAIGVIGSIVGAYFGVKIGSDGTHDAIKAQQEEATAAHVSALHTPSEKADQVVAQTIELLTAKRAGR